MNSNLPGCQMAQKATLQIAFLGGGKNSAIGRTHKIAAEMDGRFKLVAGCFSRHPDINAETARYYGVDQSRLYSTLEEMLTAERGRLDAVVILTPTSHHLSAVLTCLENSVPVICEKALATTAVGVKDIRSVLAARKGFLALTYNYTGYPMIRELRNLVRTGQLGRVMQIQAEMPQEGFLSLDLSGRPRPPQTWRLTDLNISTISLDLGTHLHSLVSYITGEKPERVVSQVARNGHFAEVVDTVSCMIQYSAGLHVNFWYTKAALGYRNGLKIRVFGDQASAEWVQDNPEYLSIADNKGGRRISDRACGNMNEANAERYNRFKAGHPAGFIEAFANYYWDLADALHSHSAGMAFNSASILGIAEASEAAELFEAVEVSSRERRWVDMVLR